MKKITLLLAFLPFIFISGCRGWVSTHYPMGDTQIWNDKETGLIIGACTESASKQMPQNTYCRFFMGEKQKDHIQIGATGPSLGGDGLIYDRSNQQKNRKVFAIPVPEGDWYFSEWGVSIYPYWAEYELEEPLFNELKINVKKGQIVYIGDYQLNIQYGGQRETLTGVVDIIRGANVQIVDNYSKDISLVKEKYSLPKNIRIENKSQGLVVPVVRPILYRN